MSLQNKKSSEACCKGAGRGSAEFAHPSLFVVLLLLACAVDPASAIGCTRLPYGQNIKWSTETKNLLQTWTNVDFEENLYNGCKNRDSSLKSTNCADAVLPLNVLLSFLHADGGDGEWVPKLDCRFGLGTYLSGGDAQSEHDRCRLVATQLNRVNSNTIGTLLGGAGLDGTGKTEKEKWKLWADDYYEAKLQDAIANTLQTPFAPQAHTEKNSYATQLKSYNPSSSGDTNKFVLNEIVRRVVDLETDASKNTAATVSNVAAAIKASRDEVDVELGKKATTAFVVEQLKTKAAAADVATKLDTKVDQTAVDAILLRLQTLEDDKILQDAKIQSLEDDNIEKDGKIQKLEDALADRRAREKSNGKKPSGKPEGSQHPNSNTAHQDANNPVAELCPNQDDPPGCATVDAAACGTMFEFAAANTTNAMNVTDFCPWLCNTNISCNKSGPSIDADVPGTSSSSSATAIAVAMSVVGVIIVAIAGFMIMRKGERGRQRALTHSKKKTTRKQRKAAEAAAVAAELGGGDTFEMISVSELGNHKSAAAAATVPNNSLYNGVPPASPATTVPSDDLYSPVSSSSTKLFDRVVPIVCELYSEINANPLAGLSSVATMTLKAALEMAALHCGNIAKVGTNAIAFADTFDMRAYPEGFTLNGVAVINAYTQESPLYGGMNAALGGYGKDGRKPLRHYLPYIKLLQDSMKPLLPVKAADGADFVTLYRGVKMPASSLLGGLGVGDTLTWWSFTSTTTTPDVLQSTDFLGIGNKGAAAARGIKRTVFHIKAFNGINIKPFSAINGEDEVLFLPGSQFVIEGTSEWHYGITEVRLRQVPSAVMSMDDEAADAGLYDMPAANSDGNLQSPLYDDIDDYMVPVPVNSGDDGGNNVSIVYAEPVDMEYIEIVGAGGASKLYAIPMEAPRAPVQSGQCKQLRGNALASIKNTTNEEDC